MARKISVLMLTLMGDDPATARYYAGVARTLDTERFRLVFGTIRGRGVVQERVEAHGHTTFCLNCQSRGDYLRAVLALSRIIRQEQIDVLHGNEELGGFLCGLAGILARRGGRIYHRQHDYSLSFNPGEGLTGSLAQKGRLLISSANYQIVDGMAGRLAHRVLTLADNHSQAVLREHPDWLSKISVAYHGVDAPADLAADQDIAREIPQQLRLEPQVPVLAIVARLNWRKGHDILFEALQYLRDNYGLEPVLLVVGYGPLEADLKASAELRGLRRVKFVGKQSNVLPWFLAADIALMPSLTEPFGLVAAEAMACGRPVIASRVGGLQEVVLDRQTGLLVPPGEVIALAKAIKSLIDDPGRAREMGRRGRLRYEQEFTQEAMTRRWEQNYLDLLNVRQIALEKGVTV